MKSERITGSWRTGKSENNDLSPLANVDCEASYNLLLISPKLSIKLSSKL